MGIMVDLSLNYMGPGCFWGPEVEKRVAFEFDSMLLGLACHLGNTKNASDAP